MRVIGKRSFIIFLILSSLFLVIFQLREKMYNSLLYIRTRVSELLQGRGLTDEQIAILSDLIARQAYHETGGFTSDIFKENKNLFGMKESTRSYDHGVNRGHAVYYNYDDSIRDILAYMAARKGGLKSFVLTVPLYAQRLKDLSYYEDSVANYTKGLKYAV
jgi:flagellum-specific peptidoglycan hydrolase FlgJ